MRTADETWQLVGIGHGNQKDATPYELDDTWLMREPRRGSGSEPAAGTALPRVVIEVWFADYPFLTYDGRPFLDPLRKRAEEFSQAHPTYRIDVRGYDFTTMADEVRRAVQQGHPPDIAGYYATDTQVARDMLAGNGKPLFTSVEKAVRGRREILGEPVLLDDVVPAARDFYTYDGDLTSLPLTATTTLLYSNATWLEAAGVSKPPRTWDEVEAACEALARLDNGPSHRITWPNHGWLFQQAVAQQGGHLADHDNGRSGRAARIDLASTQMLAFANWWRRLHRDGHYLYTGTQEDWAGCFAAFAEQRVAFTIDSSKSTEEIVRAGKDAGFRVEVSLMPYNGNVAYAGNLVSGDSLWLADGLDETKQDGALAFMQYLISPRNAADWHTSNGFVPITRAASQLLEREGWFERYPYQQVAIDQLRAANATPAALGAMLGSFDDIHGVMAQAMEDVLIRGSDPTARFTEATADAQRLLDNDNAAPGVAYREGIRGGSGSMSVAEASHSPNIRVERIPLSTNQEFLCMFDQGDAVGPFGPSYHIAGGWRVQGRINVATLRKALDDVVARHEALRTVVVRDEGDRYQRIYPPCSVNLTVRDISEADPDLRDLRAQELLNEVESGMYSVREMPLLRAFLGRFDGRDAVLVLQAHHTAADAWSMQLIMRDVAVRYAARQGHALPELPAIGQYQDFARWQREATADATTNASREHWREKLRGAQVLAIRADWPRSAKRPKASSWHRFSIDHELTAVALEIARTTRSTPFMVLLAAYKVFLHAMTGATDIVVPTFAPGRTQARFQNSVGSFFNFLPLRTDLAGCETFLDVVGRTRAACIEAYSHEIAFGQIVEEVPEVAAPMSQDDLAVFVFQVERTLFATEELVGNLTYSEVRRRLSAPVGGDIPDGSLWTLSIDPAGDTVGSLAFNSNRFDATTAGEMVSDFRRVVRNVLTAPGSALAPSRSMTW